MRRSKCSALSGRPICFQGRWTSPFRSTLHVSLPTTSITRTSQMLSHGLEELPKETIGACASYSVSVECPGFVSLLGPRAGSSITSTLCSISARIPMCLGYVSRCVTFWLSSLPPPERVGVRHRTSSLSSMFICSHPQTIKT